MKTQNVEKLFTVEYDFFTQMREIEKLNCGTLIFTCFNCKKKSQINFSRQTFSWISPQQSKTQLAVKLAYFNILKLTYFSILKLAYAMTKVSVA